MTVSIRSVGNRDRSDRRLSIRAIAKAVGIDKESVPTSNLLKDKLWALHQEYQDSAPPQSTLSAREVSSQVQHPRLSTLFNGPCCV